MLERSSDGVPPKISSQASVDDDHSGYPCRCPDPCAQHPSNWWRKANEDWAQERAWEDYRVREDIETIWLRYALREKRKGNPKPMADLKELQRRCPNRLPRHIVSVSTPWT